jgi:4a-hydroxytetrahydrobiopterin dehydratase
LVKAEVGGIISLSRRIIHNVRRSPVTLAKEKCIACRRDSPRVTDEDIAELHPIVPEWRLTEDDGIKRLDRTFKVDNFASAIAFADDVAEAAEGEGHHPRLTVEWGRVNVAWWTHKIRGLHRNDFIMAAQTDELFAGRE